MNPDTLAIVAGHIYATLLAGHGVETSDEDRAELRDMALDDAVALVRAATLRATTLDEPRLPFHRRDLALLDMAPRAAP